MKSSKNILIWAAPCLIAMPAITGCTTQAKETVKEKPNFLIWVADDQYLESVGCYGGFHEQTPNIDKLASEGLRFTNAYSTASVSTPARSALYTGMYPIKNGSHPNHSGLKADIPSMPGIMSKLGYRSALVGKEGVHKLPTRPTNTFDWDAEYPHTKVTIKGAEWDEKASKKHREIDYEGVREFINNDSLPFCMFVASSLPHGPLLTKLDNGLEGYPANNWYTDNQFGKFIEMLEEAGKIENTIVIFVSDNGSNTPLSKYTLYESGVHIPMIISWPGHIEDNSLTDALVDFTDIMPTLMEIAGSEANQEMDGKSLLPLFKGEDVVIREDIFLSYTNLGVNGETMPFPIRAVVSGNYKLIHFLNHEIIPPKGNGVTKSPEYELFDLQNDPSESVNLYENEEFSELREDMKVRLQKWIEEVGDKGMETEYEAVKMFPEEIGHLKMQL